MPAILDNKNPSSPSVFRPAVLLREARRQKALPTVDVPAICILDPDGDIVRRLRKEGRSRPFDGWPCYHTQLDAFELAGRTAGIVGCAVGAPFAVLIAEEMFASGCQFLISLTSAGQIVPAGPTPYFVIIDRALRDEGTSYHYAAPTEYGEADPQLVRIAADALKSKGLQAIVGQTWTTDAPFRETDEAIEAAKRKASLPWKWKLLRFTLSPRLTSVASFASHMLRTLWARYTRILKKVRLMEPPMRSPSLKRSSRRADPNRGLSGCLLRVMNRRAGHRLPRPLFPQ